MHKIQIALLRLAQDHDLSIMGPREIGKILGGVHPQQVKHHLGQIYKKGLLKKEGSEKTELPRQFIEIPILGQANCGAPKSVAEQDWQGTLTISASLAPRRANIYALIAAGNSMNQAKINNKAIQDGDYIIVDGDYRSPHTGDYVVSIINGLANVKKFTLDEKNDRILLLSENDYDTTPIIINLTDFSDYLISGKVIDVIKTPKN